MTTSDEHTVAIVSFEGAIKREIKRLRNQLKQDETLSEFRLIIEASGRVNDGEVRLSYTLDQKFGLGKVEGNSLQAVVYEFQRRRGWSKTNAPKALAYEKVPSDDTIEDDEIPF